MSFKEKSSWIVLIGMIAMLAWYAQNFIRSGGFGEATTSVIVISIIVFIVLVVIGHIVAAILQAIATGKNDVDDSEDERDKSIALYGERAGGAVLGALVLLTLAVCLMNGETGIASLLFMGLIASEIAKHGWQVFLYRRSA